MRIIHLTKYLPQFPGGIEQATKAMALAGQALGAEVEIVGVPPSAEDTVLPKMTAVSELPLKVLNFHVGNVPFAPGFFFLNDRLRRADLIHVHLPNPMAELALLLFSAQNFPPVVPIVHAPLVRWGKVADVWQRMVHRPLIQRAESVIVGSPQLLHCLRETSAFPEAEKTHVIPFGIPASPFTGHSTVGKSGRGMQLLSIGRLVPYKGYEVLLDALAALGGDWHLTLVGRGPQAAKLKVQRARLGLTDRVKIIEGVSEEEKHRLLAECDIFLLPSQTRAESFGIVIGEAFSHGKPVITTDLPTGVAYLARGGACGDVVPVGSHEALTRAIGRLMEDPARRAQTGRANFEFWRSELHMEHYQRRYQEFLGKFFERRKLGTAA